MPGTLTAGLVEPEVVERCRDNYNMELDQQLQEAIRSLEQKNAEKKMRLRQEVWKRKQQYNDEVENQLLEQARVVVEQFSDRMAVLQGEAERQRQRLEREAQELLHESQRYYHFKAEARRLLGSSASVMPSFQRAFQSGYDAPMPRFERDAPVLPTLLSQGSPNIHDLLNGVPNLGVPPVAPPPPPPKRTVPRASSNSIGRQCGAMAYHSSNPTAQAVPMMPPPRTQSTVSAGVSPMSATRFLQTVNRGIQAGSPPGGPSPVGTFATVPEWTPPETPRPCPPTVANPAVPPNPFPSQSPLGLPMQGLAAPKTVWHPAPRGVSQMFPEDFFMPGDVAAANSTPTPCLTGMTEFSDNKVTSM
eukprot:symbB.v1.2.003389.t1/scaffold190.1/size276550/14